MRQFLVTLLLLFFGFTAISQTVEGTVLDFETREPVPFATLVFKGTSIGAITDFEGKFVIKNSINPKDTLIISCIGYSAFAIAKSDIPKSNFTIELKTNQVNLKAVEIKARPKKENPAIPIIKAVISNRSKNAPDKLGAYEVEIYNKLEFDMNNISEDFQNRKVMRPFQFMFENMDTTNGKNYLPIFLSESLSDFYYRRDPRLKKEIVKATKVSGLENESVTSVLGEMYQSIDIYDNNVRLFGRSFISPIAAGGLIYYRYYLLDSIAVEGRKTFQLRFVPKRFGEPLFSGDLYVDAETYAVASISAEMSEDANVNFIRSFMFEQDFLYQDEHWLLKRDKLLVDFSLGDKAMGMFGKKTSSYQNYTINQPKDPDFFDAARPTEVLDDHKMKTKDFWAEARHESLSTSELKVYTMVDSLKTVPKFNTYLELIQIVFTGYKVIGNVELGPYSKLYSYNPVEGNRFRFGMRTSNKFSTRLAIEGFGAYGLLDKKWKYGLSTFYFLDKSPRTILKAKYSKDIVQLGQSSNSIDQDNVFSSAFRRNPATKLSLESTFGMSLSREWQPGFSSEIGARHTDLKALGSLSFAGVIRGNSRDTTRGENDLISLSEVTIGTRFAYREKFVEGEFDRISLGSDYPVIQGSLTFGVKMPTYGDFEYQKLRLSVQHTTPLGIFGDLSWKVEGGKTWGNAPYPLQEVHVGNETFFLQQDAFNTMNFFEFVSTDFIALYGEHHFQGFFLNRVPLLKKLKWRELVTAKAVYGRYKLNPEVETGLPDFINTLEKKPYLEASIGIENIFKFLRLEGLYRLSYLDNPNIVRYGIRAKFQFKF
tara:strand:- start:103093 stop:105558 length:2466 start_codon:yes stop_codon:yes gene_type:complete